MSDTSNRQQADPQRGGATTGDMTAAAPGGAPERQETAATADAARGYVPRPAPGYDDVRAAGRGPGGAARGGTILAATFMMVAGLLGFFEGLAAVIRGSFFAVLPNYAFSLSASGWGIVHMILGVLLLATGAALFADRTWARVVGGALAAFMLVANFVYLPYYPVWAIVVIALDAFVLWALLAPRHR